MPNVEEYQRKITYLVKNIASEKRLKEIYDFARDMAFRGFPN